MRLVLRVTITQPTLSPIYRGQAQQPDADPDQSAEAPQEYKRNGGDVAVAEGSHEETL